MYKLASFSFLRPDLPLGVYVLPGITAQLAPKTPGKCPAQLGHGMNRKEAEIPPGVDYAHLDISVAAQDVFPLQGLVLQVRR